MKNLADRFRCEKTGLFAELGLISGLVTLSIVSLQTQPPLDLNRMLNAQPVVTQEDTVPTLRSFLKSDR